jgi:hypothetical protein
MIAQRCDQSSISSKNGAVGFLMVIQIFMNDLEENQSQVRCQRLGVKQQLKKIQLIFYGRVAEQFFAF